MLLTSLPLRLALALSLVPLATERAEAQVGFGLTWTGSLYSIDVGTGVTTLLGNTGWGQNNALSLDSDGTLYAVLDQGERLMSLDPTSAFATQLALVSMGDVRALAVDPASGDLFAIVDSSVNSTASDTLWRIHHTTWQKQFVGLTGGLGLQGLDFAPNGTLYGWDIGGFGQDGPGLVTLDTVSGLATPVAPGVDNGTNEQSLCFGPDGTCYVTNGTIYTVDLVTGVKTVHSTTPISTLRGLDLPTPQLGQPFCTAAPNSTGLGATLTAVGSASVAANALHFHVGGLPPNQFGYFVMGQSVGIVGVGQGLLCVAVPFVRFDQDILDSGLSGTYSFQPDLSALPQATVIQPGDVWLFQCWYRDNNPSATSNLTDGVQITFE